MKLALAAVLALLAAPSFAQDAMMSDATKMTCKDLMAMDATGMMEAGKAINTAMMADTSTTAMADTTKSTTAMSDTTAMAMSDEDTMKAAEAACTAHPDAMVIDAMKM